MASIGAQLYDEDIVLWAEEQAAVLRAAAHSGTNLAIDWENVAEEIEDLAKSRRRELRSRLATIMEHLLKLDHSPASEPRAGWRESIVRERIEIEALLDDAPSLRREIPEMIAKGAPRALRLATSAMQSHGEATGTLEPPSYTEEQVLGDWFPEAPPPAP